MKLIFLVKTCSLTCKCTTSASIVNTVLISKLMPVKYNNKNRNVCFRRLWKLLYSASYYFFMLTYFLWLLNSLYEQFHQIFFLFALILRFDRCATYQTLKSKQKEKKPGETVQIKSSAAIKSKLA